ncbi:ribosome small subunit-dependent GTPase A [Alicyclobacillus sp. SO9]|uniref:ribosome small subunit-dependent GTPase A n=1 Tax=Alicyclobacillus sp. SO9 TaxID=2665646 RepID=UPI001E641E5E|nr:ribosome small subunit-dependent GTPase A [Alicyclobacillus sp. SO9]
MNLKNLGWSEVQERAFQTIHEQGQVGRVAAEQKGVYDLYTERGPVKAVVTGKLQHTAKHRGDFPAVGDWVVTASEVTTASFARIHSILPRMSTFSRKEAGFVTEEQIVATNVDTVFVVTGLDANFNVRRIERMLLAAWESGASPVVVLTKSDLCDAVDNRIDDVKQVAVGVPVYAVSSVTKVGLERLNTYLQEGTTTVLLGSSGVGKSSLINHFMRRPVQTVQAARARDARGRHTTTYRQLLLLPDGGMMIDTPGIRELQLWDASDGLENVFSDIEKLSGQCKFRNCTHQSEPGCAVKEAIESGTLSVTRLQNYSKMEREWQRTEEKKRRLERLKGKGKYCRVRNH